MNEMDSTKDKIKDILYDLVAEGRLVIWYDDGGQMRDFVSELSMDGVEILMLENNAFTIKHRILTGEQPEKGFLIYSPKSRPSDSENWLLDIEVQAKQFSADMGSLYAAECKIPLDIKDLVVDTHLEFFKIATNRTRLAARMIEGMDVKDIERQMISIVSKTEASYSQLALVLIREALQEKKEICNKLSKYNLDGLFWGEIASAFRYKGKHQIKDLLVVLFKDDLDRRLGEGKLGNEAHIFMRDWRDSRQHGETYKAWAEVLEKEMRVKETLQNYPLEKLLAIETFPCVDKIIAQYLQMMVLEGTINVDKLEAIVEEREGKLFFSRAAHAIRALLEARRMFEEIDLRTADLTINSPARGIELYCSGLYSIDSHYRHYFREAKDSEIVGLLADVTEKVQRVYTNMFLQKLSYKWQAVLDSMIKWDIPSVTSQRKFYKTYVQPFVSKGNKLFVIISDAMRYEVAVELEQRINQVNRMSAEMKPAMYSTLPSYTQLGMAALLPHNELSYEKDADEVFADGSSTKGTEARGKILEKAVSRSLAINTENFLKIGNPRVYLKDFDLIYIYSNKIDTVGDKKETEGNVFSACEYEIENIVKVVELIRNSNGANILITADHGFLYQNEVLDDSDFADFKLMGDVIGGSRRFVIGKDLVPGSAVRTWNSKDVGLNKGVQIQIANGMNRIKKQGSGSRFVHGGAMLQEIVVPVIHVNIKKVVDVSQVNVDILNKRSRLTTNSQTISFYQTEAVTEKVKGSVIKAGFYDRSGNPISDVATMNFNSTSNDTVQREQKHTFLFKSELSKLNGQTVYLRMEKQVTDSEQFAPYMEIEYKVSIMFQAEF